MRLLIRVDSRGQDAVSHHHALLTDESQMARIEVRSIRHPRPGFILITGGVFFIEADQLFGKIDQILRVMVAAGHRRDE